MNPEQPKPGGNPPPQNDYGQPVAYDKDGNPLYAAPQQFVHMSRAIQPMEEHVPPAIMELHKDSVRRFPRLNFSNGEYVISAIQRHPIGMLKIWGIGLTLIVAFMAVYILAFAGPTASSNLGDFSGIAIAVLAVMLILVSLGTMAATYVYNANRFYLTNESVIQEVQTTIFSRYEQTVSLANIEDASYKQGGIFPMLFNYGQIRLSTEGDETTYRFNYVSNPKRQIAILNNAVESFKNGRAMDPPHDDQAS